MSSSQSKAASQSGILKEFTSQVQTFDFRGDAVDMALRKLLAKVLLPKEAQLIDRAMEEFAKRYQDCNPHLVDSHDPVYAVSFSMLLLHTDAHNKNVRQKMNKETFIRRTRDLEGGERVPVEVLDIMYDNIVFSEFTYAESNAFINRATDKSTSWFAKLKSDSASGAPMTQWMADLYPKLDQLMPVEDSLSYSHAFRGANLPAVHAAFLHAPRVLLAGVRSSHNASGPTHSNSSMHSVRVCKAGIIDRKYDIATGGKKASTRGWRPFGVILSGSQIIFFADLATFQTWMDRDDGVLETDESDLGHDEVMNYDTYPGRRGYYPAGSVRSTASVPISLLQAGQSSPASLHFAANTPTLTSFASIYSSQSIASNYNFSPTSSSRPSTSSASSTRTASPVSSATAASHLRPVQIISLYNAVCVHDATYTKYPHVFRLITQDGQQYMMRARNDTEMCEWMLHINYAATVRTTGVQLFSLRSPPTSLSEDYADTKQRRREEKAKAKIVELADQMAPVERLLRRELQVRDNLMVLVPLLKSTKDRMLVFADRVGKRITSHRMGYQRLACYRDFLDKTLCGQADKKRYSRRSSCPHIPPLMFEHVALEASLSLDDSFSTLNGFKEEIVPGQRVSKFIESKQGSDSASVKTEASELSRLHLNSSTTASVTTTTAHSSPMSAISHESSARINDKFLRRRSQSNPPRPQSSMFVRPFKDAYGANYGVRVKSLLGAWS